MQKWMVINMPEKYIKSSDCEKYFYEHLDDVHIAAAMNAVDEMPAADVVPVRHGYWIEQENWTTDDYYYTCSACGEDYNTIDGTPDYNFCPNCGAKMDGGVKRNE